MHCHCRVFENSAPVSGKKTEMQYVRCQLLRMYIFFVFVYVFHFSLKFLSDNEVNTEFLALLFSHILDPV